jgi:hypothetical protein
MKDFKLIMVSAWHEQGGNVFHRHLDGHPNLFVYPFESQISTPKSDSVIDDSFVRNRYRYPEFTTEMLPEAAYQSIWDEELKTLLRTPYRSKFKDCGLVMDENKRVEIFKSYFEFKSQRDTNLVGIVPPTLWRTRPAYIEALFRSTFEAWENYNKTGKETHYVGYSPPILFNADKFFHDFPEGQMIHVVRNPFSGYADSCRRPFPMGMTKYCTVWNFAQLQALTLLRKYPNQFHVVSYESLMCDKQSTMESLMSKMGLPYSDTLLYPSFNGRKLEQAYPWGTIITPTEEANIATAKELTKEQIVQIRLECANMLDLFGLGEFDKKLA